MYVRVGWELMCDRAHPYEEVPYQVYRVEDF